MKGVIAWSAALLYVFPSTVFAEDKSDLERRKAELRKPWELVQPDAQRAASAAATPGPAQGDAVVALKEIVVTDTPPPVHEAPIGQTHFTLDRNVFKNSTGFSIGDILNKTPGVTVVQANGPRDVSVSVRGSNARQTYGVRNVVLFEDGFPVTQPDGLGRTDLTDPHAYGAIDVSQGPSSARYGNYATGGAINFHTRAGGAIQGVEAAFDAGSYGYRNVYTTAGARGEHYDYTLFASRVSGDGTTYHNHYTTTTLNFLATYQPTTQDKFTFKFINNDLNTDLSIRLSLDQYRKNPYQTGCSDIAVAGCASVSLFANGFNGTRVDTSAKQAALGRNDRRTVAGARWEHTFGPDTTLRTQFVFDNRDIKQPTGANSANGTYPSFNVMTDLTHVGTLFGLHATHTVGAFWNYENNNSATYNVVATGPTAPGGRSHLGALTQTVVGTHQNYGARAREELTFNKQWQAVAGIGVEHTNLDAEQTGFTYPTAESPTTTIITAKRDFTNVAPEAALIFTPDDSWTFHARVASGYGTPQMTNLFVTPQGTTGNNAQLKSQSNWGIDLGADLTLGRTLNATLIMFYEWFQNELVTQSPGASLMSYTFNAPRSEHRGFEVAADWRPLSALRGAFARLSYMLDDQRYTKYTERLSAGAQSTAFDRSGKRIPGVFPQSLSARLGYDQRDGLLRGLGGFIETDMRTAYFIDNGNSAKVPSYALVNLNLHYNNEIDGRYLKGVHVFFEVRNLLDKTYVASASNVSNSISAADGTQNPASSVGAATGSIYAGSPRTFYGGVRLKF